MFTLGTANFGNSYSGSTSFIDCEKANSIISKFIDLGGEQLDSAETYGNSLSILEHLSNYEFSICTKFSSHKMLNPIIFRSYLQKLWEKYGFRINFLLLHDVTHIIEMPDESLKILHEYLNINSSAKFGVSIYNKEELFAALEVFNCISAVQAPLNYLDRRFITREFANLCEEHNIKVFYRSIFLQGKLLYNVDELEPYFKQFKELEFFHDDFVRSGCRTLLEFNLRFINSVTDFSKIVLGVETPKQLDEIAENMILIKKQNNYKSFSAIGYNSSLCIPMNWKLL